MWIKCHWSGAGALTRIVDRRRGGGLPRAWWRAPTPTDRWNEPSPQGVGASFADTLADRPWQMVIPTARPGRFLLPVIWPVAGADFRALAPAARGPRRVAFAGNGAGGFEAYKRAGGETLFPRSLCTDRSSGDSA